MEGQVNVLALALLATSAFLTLSVPRGVAASPLLVVTCLLPMGQEVVAFGLHFYLFRILLLVGLLRVVFRREAAKLRLTSLDWLFGWWVVISVVLGTVGEPSIPLLISRLGDAYNAVGCYLFARCVVVDIEDIASGIRTLAVMSVIVGTLMLVERTTTHNLLSMFGGVPELTAVRGDELRAQGAFRHPILAGTFGATQLPLFVGLWWYRRKDHALAALGAIFALVIVFSASSGGALIAAVLGLVGLVLWRLKRHIYVVRWAAVISIILLAMIMKAPVWYLFDRLSSVTGGTGWHRAFLIDQTIAHFHEWWLFGTTYTAHWGPGGEVTVGDPRMMDITNHYVMEGVKGGIAKLGLFIAMIAHSFRLIGRRIRAEREEASAFLCWAIGASLFTHSVSFLSATYFDQLIVIWFWLLAVISSLGIVREGTPRSGTLARTQGV